jgi:hypothetical protein
MADSSGADAPGEPAGGAGADDSAGAEDKIADAPDAVEMMARASRFVSRQILALMDRADRCGGRLDKSQIDGLAVDVAHDGPLGGVGQGQANRRQEKER